MSGDNISRVTGIQFDIYGNQEVLNSSVVDSEGIIYPETYDNGEPKFGGVLDTRLGTSDQFTLCSTCKCNYLECPSHFGHVKLVTPMFHFGLMSYVKSVLQCIDLKNGKLLVSKEDISNKVISKSNKARFAEIKALCSSVKVSPYSGTPVPSLKVDIKKNQGLISITADYVVGINDELDLQNSSVSDAATDNKKKITQVLTAADCYYILKNISDADCELLGISRPERMILTIFPVPPPAIRPSVRGDFTNQGYSEHGTTHKLVDIIKLNMRLKAQIEKSISTSDNNTKHIDDYQNCLQYHIAT